MSRLLTKKQVIEIARVKLPIVVEALNRANLEAQKSNADTTKIREILMSDDIDSFYDVGDLLDAVHKLEPKSKLQGGGE